jgi:predicted helicase
VSSNALQNPIIAKCQSWADFVQSVSSLSKAGKGKVFERLTQLYLQTKPEYQTSLKEVWLLADIPVRVRRKLPSLPRSDEGIDLVAETRSGEFWAFQCKYKSDKDTALTVRRGR